MTKNLGIPSYVDPINNKYFYFSEKSQKKSIFKKEVQYSYIFVFEFDSNNKIINSNVYDLKNKKSINLIENETSSDIVRRGLLERIFGGIGPQQTLGNTP